MNSTDITLNNGVVLPALGFGVYQIPPDETKSAVAEALRIGYRHIDTAAVYGNERGVGEAIAESGIPRDEIFIETKVWISDYGFDKTPLAFEKAAGELSVDMIDLLILHHPLTREFDHTVQAYKVLEKLHAEGKVRAIGVSNFMPGDLTELLAQTEMRPAVNQIELHPYFQQPEVVALNREQAITTQAWSPIGGITFYPRHSDGRRGTLSDPAIIEIATAHGKTPAQVMLRWHIQNGVQVIPKSARPERILENFDVFGFALTADEVAAIDALDKGVRGGPEPASLSRSTHGMPTPET